MAELAGVATADAVPEELPASELDAAIDGAVAISDGTMAPSDLGDDADLAPDLPASMFTAAEPGIDFAALVVADTEPAGDDRTEDLARELLLYERELGLLDDPGATARLRVEAGRLAERLGDLDRARSHYDGALQLDPRLRPPLRALRRVERLLGNFGEAVRHLDAEIELSDAMERRALAAYRADLLMAIGEQDLARVAVGELLDDAPADVRALLANLELAWVDGRQAELDSTLERLARAVADQALSGALSRTRAMLAEAAGGDGRPALRVALLTDPSDRLAWLGLAHGAAARGEEAEVSEAVASLVGQGAAGTMAPALAGALEWRRAGHLVRSAAVASSTDEAVGQRQAAAAALASAVQLLPDRIGLLEEHAESLIDAGRGADAADVLERLAELLPPGPRAADACCRAARLRVSAGDRDSAVLALRQALVRAPGDPLALAAMAALAAEAGDEETLADLDRRELAADPEAVLARARLARRLEALGRAPEAVTTLEAGRAAGLRSAALDEDLARLYHGTGQLAARAELFRDQADEGVSYLDPVVAHRRAAAALEELADRPPPAQPPAGSGGGGLGDDWDDRSASAFLATSQPEPAAAPPPAPESTAPPPESPASLLADAADGVPEPIFGPPSARVSGEPSGPVVGVWHEPAPASSPISAPAGVAAPAAAAAPVDHLEQALVAWRRVLELDPDSAAARAGALRLAERRGDRAERLAVLGEAQRGASQPAWATELALRRAELLGESPDGDAGAAEAVLRSAVGLEPANPRATLALCRVLAASGRWHDAAELLVERADAVGASDEAVALRYRAAAMLFDRTEEVSRAASLLTPVVNARPDFLIAGELLRAAQRRLGEAAPAVDPVATAPISERTAKGQLPTGGSGAGDTFARLVREAEVIEAQLGDLGRAADLYRQALAVRPDDPLAKDGFARAAAQAGETAPLAEMALADLRQAESLADGAAKAAAYEELARIDADLRGDTASAILAWESAIASDPGRMSSVRKLERAYLGAGRERDLMRLYHNLVGTIEGPHDRRTVLVEMARLCQRLDLPRDRVLEAFHRIHEVDPGDRMALFRLEAAAREDGPSPELAELEQSVARHFAGDPRAEAAFLTRAGETLRSLGDLEGAIASFRGATAALPGYGPALSGWRDAAVAGEMWLDVADAAEREAESTPGDADKARLYHLAGVVLMDRALLGDRAIGALRRVIDLDPRHTDGFLRLKLLYEEMGRDVELIELYQRRLEVEDDPSMQVALNLGVAALYRNFFDDREAARRHLKAALAIDPENLRAVADLSDIAWELGDWADAAETLIARAKLETRPQVLRNIYYRLGTIYADRLPDTRFAMMSFQKVLTYDPNDAGALTRVADLALASGDYRLALGACEHLIKHAASDAEKVPHLHRVARIYLEGWNDRQRAERAYRIALDLDPTSEVALAELVGFYRDAGDMRSVRVHLDRVVGAMRQRIAADPAQLLPYQVAARALEARDVAGVPGSLATAHAAGEIAAILGSQDPHDAELAAAAARARPPLAGLGQPEIDETLFPPAASGALRALFRLLGERIAKQVGIDVRRYGVGRAERLRKGSDPLAGMILEMAGEMGFDDVDIYLSQRQPLVLAAEPTHPVSLVLGAQLATLDRPAELRFLVGRALKLALSNLAVPARMAPEELGVLLAGLLRQFSPEFAPPGLDPDQVAAEQQKLRRLIPSGMLQELGPFALGIAGQTFDYRAIWTGVIEGGNRAGLLAAGSPAPALASVLRLGGYRDIHQGIHDPLVTGLLRFAVSEDHAALRAQLSDRPHIPHT